MATAKKVKTTAETAPTKPAKAAKAAAKPAKAPKPQLLAAGAKAPAFTLPDDAGKPVSLASFAGKTVVLFFYPKDDTPGCTRESCAFQEGLAAFRKQGAVVLGVSRDGAASHQRFKAKYGLAFPLLTDADRKVHEAYGAWGHKLMYGKPVEGVIRTTVVIDGAGKIAAVFSPVKVDGHAEKVLEAVIAAS